MAGARVKDLPRDETGFRPRLYQRHLRQHLRFDFSYCVVYISYTLTCFSVIGRDEQEAEENNKPTYHFELVADCESSNGRILDFRLAKNQHPVLYWILNQTYST